MTAAAPSGVVTFLFTDVEGSTRRWEADADAMRVALVAHDEVLLHAIEAQGVSHAITACAATSPSGGSPSRSGESWLANRSTPMVVNPSTSERCCEAQVDTSFARPADGRRSSCLTCTL
jgi:class 3 adenylate cyclase